MFDNFVFDLKMQIQQLGKLLLEQKMYKIGSRTYLLFLTSIEAAHK